MYSKLVLLEKFLQHVIHTCEDYSDFSDKECRENLKMIVGMAFLLDDIFTRNSLEDNNI